MKLSIMLILTVTAILITSGMLFAQPALPSPPSQAPIDGGLGLLAAAGGAYAWKKLRNKQE